MLLFKTYVHVQFGNFVNNPFEKTFMCPTVPQWDWDRKSVPLWDKNEKSVPQWDRKMSHCVTKKCPTVGQK